MSRFTRSTLVMAMIAAAIGVSAAPALAKKEHFTIGGKASGDRQRKAGRRDLPQHAR